MSDNNGNKGSELDRPEPTPQARENRSVNTDVPGAKRQDATRRQDSPQAGAPDSAEQPRMPHERDESAGMTGGAQSGTVQQGARDLQRGLQDTDKKPVMDSTYEKQKK